MLSKFTQQNKKERQSWSIYFSKMEMKAGEPEVYIMWPMYTFNVKPFLGMNMKAKGAL